MILLYFLRALTELGLYYTAAGPIAHIYGGTFALPGMLLQCACFTLCAALRRRKWARLLGLVPMLLFFAFAQRAADLIAYAPAALYVCYLVWTEDFGLTWGRQANVLSVFWKAALGLGLFLTLLGRWDSVAHTGLPVALLTAAASVLLLRTLRHDPEVYLQRSYQLMNFVSLLAVLLIAGLVGNRWLVGGVLFLVKCIYNYAVVPLIMGIAMLVGYVLLAIWPEGDAAGIYSDIMAAMQSADTLGEQVEERGSMGFTVPWQPFAILGVLAAAAVLFLFFRWLARQREPDAETSAMPVRRTGPGAPAKQSSRPAKYDQRVRVCYRSFLKYCRKNGVSLLISDTSSDVSAKAAVTNRADLEAFQSLYQKARYRGGATREDAARAKELLKRLKAE